nr:hypothetical protein [Tanacetum cinerariifolium]
SELPLNSYAIATDLSEMELKKILIKKMEGNKSIQCLNEQRNLYKALVEAYESDKILLDTYGETVTLKRRRDDDEDKNEEPSDVPERGSKRRREGKEPESLSAPSETATKNTGRNLYKALVEAYESDKILLDTYGETVTLKRRRDDDEDKNEEPSAVPDRGSKRRREGKEPESPSAPSETATKNTGRSTTRSRSRQASASESAFCRGACADYLSDGRALTPRNLPAVHESIQLWISELAKQADTRSSFNELMDTPLDFSNFIMNRLRVDTLTPEILAGPTYDLMKGSCKSLIELEYYLEEDYKATTDQLDWVNPEG